LGDGTFPPVREKVECWVFGLNYCEQEGSQIMETERDILRAISDKLGIGKREIDPRAPRAHRKKWAKEALEKPKSAEELASAASSIAPWSAPAKHSRKENERRERRRAARKIRRLRRKAEERMLAPIEVPAGMVGLPAEMYVRAREKERRELLREHVEEKLGPAPPAPGEVEKLREEFVDGRPFDDNRRFWQYGPYEKPRMSEQDAAHKSERHRPSSPWGRKGREKAIRWLRLQELEKMLRE
jgi:hypothetical protein